jgi:hypothetical protein
MDSPSFPQETEKDGMTEAPIAGDDQEGDSTVLPAQYLTISPL